MVVMRRGRSVQVVARTGFSVVGAVENILQWVLVPLV